MKDLTIYRIAQVLQTFIKEGGDVTTEGIYRIILSNKNLAFVFSVLEEKDIPILVFTAYEIYENHVGHEIVTTIRNNLFAFSTIKFGQIQDTIECNRCDGDGRLGCSTCFGDGYVDCRNCDGGFIECDDCDGTGKYDNEDCDSCDGSGRSTCGYCDGDEQIDCSDCDGDGVEECWECEGTGSDSIPDSAPFELEQWVSYDENLKFLIEKKYRKRKNIKESEQFDKSLLLKIDEVDVNDNLTRNIRSEFENKTYVDMYEDMSDLQFIRRGFFIEVPGFSNPDVDKFK